MRQQEQTSVLFGLVLSGGKSTRMKRDKSILNYWGKPQTRFGYDLLLPFCENVFISNRKDQKKLPEHKDLPQLHDNEQYAGIGPLAGILSAFQKYPKQAWLVLGCDLPFLSNSTLENLLAQRNPLKIATAYRSEYDGLPEPLCAVYEPEAGPIFLNFFSQGIFCPRKILLSSNTHLIDLQHPKALDNINTQEEYNSSLKRINHQI